MKFFFRNAHIIVGIVCIVCLFFVATSFFDPDFPWTITQTQSLIAARSFTHANNGSYVMPSYPFFSHSWFASVLFTALYEIAGYGLISLMLAIVSTGAVFLFSRKNLWIVPLVFSAYLYGYGVRGHVISFSFLLLLIHFREFFFKKKFFTFVLLPLFMSLWANMHGGFTLGLVYLWGYIFFDRIFLSRTRNFTQKISEIWVGVVGTIGTLFTPYGIGTWTEAVVTATNTDLRMYVSEWRPINMLAGSGFVILLFLFLVTFLYDRKLSWGRIFAFLLLFQAFFSNRIVPLFAVAATSALLEVIVSLTKQKKISKQRFSKASVIFGYICLLLFVVESLGHVNMRLSAMKNFYPSSRTIDYLTTHKTEGNYFSFYRWNSYISWKTNNQPVFLDGRMIIWEQEGRDNELASAFTTYRKILFGEEDLEPTFNKFCIDTVVWSKENRTSFWEDTDSSRKIITSLPDRGWTLSYEDMSAIIYRRALPPYCLKNNDTINP